ncbi:MAG: hypothetical protein KAS90_01050 [Candidatus Aenigmarchaeota archaeon]|nr:hypothetical protein [Candidatus Aenigmarchaeota archaeon]
MSEAVNSKEIREELKAIREDLDFIKGHMIDIDSVLTEKDHIAMKEYRKDKKTGKLVSSKDIRTELGL